MHELPRRLYTVLTGLYTGMKHYRITVVTIEFWRTLLAGA